MKWKVCGMRDYANILGVAKALPDYLGFIFYAKSPRYVGEDFQLPILPRSIKKVGVFVNEDSKKIKDMAQHYQLDMVQLHGEEDWRIIDELKRAGLGVIKAVSVSKEEDFKDLERLNPDFFIFDTKMDGERGGTGRKFNWEIIPSYFSKPFFLAGGLSIEDLQIPYYHKNLIGWDFNSKLEIEPGMKDVKKIAVLASLINQYKLKYHGRI